MRASEILLKTQKEASKAESLNQQLLVRGGFVDQLSSGIFTFLPLGLRVVRKIENIIREEINAIGGVEILMPALHPKENWTTTSRWNVPEMFKTKGVSNKEYGLGWTHEEIVTPLARKFISSYKDLPLYIYQIQTKFRNEPRAKSGLLRLREFSMKDLYSFHENETDLNRYYEKVKTAYDKIFSCCGIGAETILTFASGGAFSKYSHEFQTITQAGEDTIYVCDSCKVAINKEIAGPKPKCPQCGSLKLKQEKAIEVGNIFKLGERFSKPFGLEFNDAKGKKNLVQMGCYGIGPTRVFGAITEVHHDKSGILWPKEVAPFGVYLIVLDGKEREAEKIYQELEKAGVSVLLDDREESAGSKFADADLIGIPKRMVVSAKTLAKRSVELKDRETGQMKFVKISDMLKEIKS